ncbi:MAG: hypothetical protein E7351_02805 [Clostridiales bacterium]|nr:hypothetical protein [Clostridiales bacterium]
MYIEHLEHEDFVALADSMGCDFELAEPAGKNKYYILMLVKDTHVRLEAYMTDWKFQPCDSAFRKAHYYYQSRYTNFMIDTFIDYEKTLYSSNKYKQEAGISV